APLTLRPYGLRQVRLGEVKQWDTTTWQEKAAFRAPNLLAGSVAFSPDLGTAAVVRVVQTGPVWPVCVVGLLAGDHGRGPLLAATALGQRSLPAQLTLSEISLWDLATGQERTALRGHTGFITALAFCPDGRTLASSSGEVGRLAEVKLWDVATGQERATLRGHASWVYTVAFSADG